MPALPQRTFCEWLGTAFLLAAVVGSGIMAQKLAGDDAVALLCNTLPTGAILAVLILVFGPLSGAHFNPAVSIGFALRSELPWSETGIYVVAQVLGGLVGVWIAHLGSNCRYGSSRSRSEQVQGNGLRKLSRPSVFC